jgi:hypothetical protein
MGGWVDGWMGGWVKDAGIFEAQEFLEGGALHLRESQPFQNDLLASLLASQLAFLLLEYSFRAEIIPPLESRRTNEKRRIQQNKIQIPSPIHPSTLVLPLLSASLRLCV